MSRKITIMDSNYIRAFGMNGPITSAISCEDSTVKQLIDAGHKVYEKLPDGSSKRLTRADFEIITADKIKPADKPKPVVTKVVENKEPVKVETAKVEEEGKAFNGVSATTAATIADKAEPEVDTTAMSKSQRRAQKRAKLEAAKEAENTTEE